MGVDGILIRRKIMRRVFCMYKHIENKNPNELFSTIFSDELFVSIAYNYNLYYYQYSQNKIISDSSKYERWRDTDKNVCKVF